MSTQLNQPLVQKTGGGGGKLSNLEKQVETGHWKDLGKSIISILTETKHPGGSRNQKIFCFCLFISWEMVSCSPRSPWPSDLPFLTPAPSLGLLYLGLGLNPGLCAGMLGKRSTSWATASASKRPSQNKKDSWVWWCMSVGNAEEAEAGGLPNKIKPEQKGW